MEMVKSVTFLGVLVDENLSWKDHSKYIENKVMNKLILNKNFFYKQLQNSGCLIPRPKLVLELLKFFLCNPEVRLKKEKRKKKKKKEVRLLV